MPPSKDSLLIALRNSIQEISKYGPNNPRRIQHLHYWVRDYLSIRLGNRDYQCFSWNPSEISERERLVEGSFYKKKSDVVIVRKSDNLPVGVISLKMPISNYRRNRTNYFEQMIGECINLKHGASLIHHNKLRFGAILFLPTNIPYFNIKGEYIFHEKINDEDLVKYQLLIKQIDNNENNNLLPDMINTTIFETPDIIYPWIDLEQINFIEDNKQIEKYFKKQPIIQMLAINTLISQLNYFAYQIQLDNQGTILKNRESYQEDVFHICEKDYCLYGCHLYRQKKNLQ